MKNQAKWSTILLRLGFAAICVAFVRTWMGGPNDTGPNDTNSQGSHKTLKDIPPERRSKLTRQIKDGSIKISYDMLQRTAKVMNRRLPIMMNSSMRLVRAQAYPDRRLVNYITILYGNPYKKSLYLSRLCNGDMRLLIDNGVIIEYEISDVGGKLLQKVTATKDKCNARLWLQDAH